MRRNHAICLVSGGTGGHLMPALVLARALRAAEREPVLLLEGRAVERELVRRELPEVRTEELPRGGRGAATMPWWLVRTFRAARRTLRQHGAAAVVSTGGRASLPVALAGRSLGLPLFVLEQNAVIGRANRYLMPLARRLYVGLPGDGERHARALLTGTPLRDGFGTGSRDDARAGLGIDDDVPLVVVTGGSQGARTLNEVVPAALQRVRARMQVVHLCGLGHDTDVRARYTEMAQDTLVVVRPVAADVDRLFAAADLIVCRGGGTTVAELMAVGRPAIIVPYPHHKDRQQFHNARALERVGAAIIREERELDVTSLARLVEGLLAEPSRLAAMGERGRRMRRLEAAQAIVDDIERCLGVGGVVDPVAQLPSAAQRGGAA